MFRLVKKKTVPLRFCRSQSTTAPQYIRNKPKIIDLFKTPSFKSIVLTLVFTSIVIDVTKTRKELETLANSYNSKFELLNDIIVKLNNNQSIDLAKELKMANLLTKYKYNSVVDIELDQQLEDMLKEVEEEEQQEEDVKSTNKFL